MENGTYGFPRFSDLFFDSFEHVFYLLLFFFITAFRIRLYSGVFYAVSSNFSEMSVKDPSFNKFGVTGSPHVL